MVQFDYRLRYSLMHGLFLLVQVYSGISHSGSIILLLLQASWTGQGQVVVATFRL
jgi:hypothetical protein